MIHRYISTGYLKLILVSRPDLATAIQSSLGDTYEQLFSQDTLSGELLDQIAPLIAQAGVKSLLLDFGAQLQLAAHGPLSVATLAAPDLETAIHTFIEFTPTRTNLYDTLVCKQDQRTHIKISLHSAHPLIQSWLSEVALDLARSVIEITMGHDIGTQTEYWFQGPAPSYQNALVHQLGGRCHFEAKETQMSFPSSWGRVQSPLADRVNYAEAVAQCRALLSNLGQTENSATLTRQQFEQTFNHALARFTQANAGAAAVSDVPSLIEIAELCHTTPRTLTRKLAARDTSYKSLLAQTRNQLAKEWLKNTHLNVSDIAYLLGYQEPANFHRAFKRWNQHSPQTWRKMR